MTTRNMDRTTKGQRTMQSEFIGFTAFTTNSTASHASSSDWSIDDAMRAMLQSEAEFRSRFPLSRLPVGLILGRGTLFDLEMICEKRDLWQTPAPLTGLWVRYDDDKPPNWAEVEYADGHRERVYWFGQIKGEG